MGFSARKILSDLGPLNPDQTADSFITYIERDPQKKERLINPFALRVNIQVGGFIKLILFHYQ